MILQRAVPRATTDYICQLRINDHKPILIETLNFLQFTPLDVMGQGIGQARIGILTKEIGDAALSQIHVE